MTSSLTLLAVLEELQVWAMDVLGRAVPTTGDGSSVLDPAVGAEDTLVWTAGGHVVCRVGELSTSGDGAPGQP